MKSLLVLVLFFLASQFVAAQYNSGVIYNSLPTVTTISGTSPSANSYRPPYQAPVNTVQRPPQAQTSQYPYPYQGQQPMMYSQGQQVPSQYSVQQQNGMSGTGAGVNTCQCPTPTPQASANPPSYTVSGQVSSRPPSGFNFGGPHISYR